jgi:hypothetical protein
LTALQSRNTSDRADSRFYSKTINTTGEPLA